MTVTTVEAEVMTDFQYKSMLKMFLTILHKSHYDGEETKKAILCLFSDAEGEEFLKKLEAGK